MILVMLFRKRRCSFRCSGIGTDILVKNAFKDGMIFPYFYYLTTLSPPRTSGGNPACSENIQCFTEEKAWQVDISAECV